jgi:biopolymer transport protein ExbD
MKKRRLTPETNVNLVPMIDVVFQLVVFFMVSTTFSIQPTIELNLPESQTASSTPITTLTVAIKDAQTILLNQEIHTLASLEARLETYPPEERTRSVQLMGDARVSYQLLISVLDVLRRQGFTNINLQVSPQEVR